MKSISQPVFITPEQKDHGDRAGAVGTEKGGSGFLNGRGKGVNTLVVRNRG